MLEPRLDKAELNFDTVESQKEDTARSFRDVTRFLSLVGFIALLLGCIGVASAINIYVREKINTIAYITLPGGFFYPVFPDLPDSNNLYWPDRFGYWCNPGYPDSTVTTIAFKESFAH